MAGILDGLFGASNASDGGNGAGILPPWLMRVPSAVVAAAPRPLLSSTDRLNDFVDNNRLTLMALGGGLASGGIGNGLRLAAQIGARQQLQGYRQEKDLRDYLLKLAQAKRAQTNTERKLALKERESGRAPSDAMPDDDAGDEIASPAVTAGTAGRDSADQRAGEVELAAGQFKKLVPRVTAAAGGVDRARNSDLESIMQAYGKKDGNSEIMDFGSALSDLVDSYARAVNPNAQARANDKARARMLLNKAWSSGQLSSAMRMLEQQINAARKADTSP